ncbi:MAG: cytochrome c3 family protein [Candidatus Omnitrophota bacterium]
MDRRPMKPMVRRIFLFTKTVLISAALFFLLFSCSPMPAQALEVNQGPLTYIKGATYVGTDACVACHEKEGRGCALSMHFKLNLKTDDGSAEQGCEMCHGPGSVHAENSEQKNNIINPRRDPRICFNCHAEKRMEFRLPNHHLVLEGKMSCADCHDPHGPDMVPSAASMDSLNDLCFKCHRDKQGPFVFEHPAMREGCTACHKVHGSINDKMLLARDMNLCLKCHTETNAGISGLAVSAHNHSSSQIVGSGGACWSMQCHSEVHGSNYARHLKQY